MTKSFENFLPHGGEASELFKKLTTKEDKYNSYLQTYYTRSELYVIRRSGFYYAAN